MSFFERLISTDKGKRLHQQERVILEATELICEILEQQNVSRAELATRLNSSRGHITQLLDGRANMTLRTLSDIFHALGHEMHLSSLKQARPEPSSFSR